MCQKYTVLARLWTASALILMGSRVIATTLEAASEDLVPIIKKGSTRYVDQSSEPLTYHLLSIAYLAGGGLLVAAGVFGGVQALKEKYPKRSQSKLIIFKRHRQRRR